MKQRAPETHGHGVGVKRQRGLVLVIVLWIIILLTVIATGFAYSMRTEANLARNAVDQARARYLAEAGITRAILVMLHPDPARRWPSDGSVQRFSMAQGNVRVSVRDESGFIDLNGASPQLLDGLFRVAGVEESSRASLVDAVLDWRDRDGLRRLHGAEDKEYYQFGRDYGAKDAGFEAVEELQLVLGVSPVLYRQLEPWITVHSGGGVNRAAAPRAVLLALPGASPEAVDAELANRGGSPQMPSPGAQRRRPPPPAIRPSGTYRITSSASLDSGANARLGAVVQLTRGKGAEFSVLDWKAGT